MVNRRRMPPPHLEQNISNRYLAEKINGLYEQLNGISEERFQLILDEIDNKLERLEELSQEIEGLDVSKLSSEIKSVRDGLEELRSQVGSETDELRISAVEQTILEIRSALEDSSERLSQVETDAADAKLTGESAVEDISVTRDELEELRNTVTQFTTTYQTTGCIFEKIN